MNKETTLIVRLLTIIPLLIVGCAPNRAEWMAQAASQQAQTGTSDIGTIDQIRAQAADGGRVLDIWAQAFLSMAVDPNQKADVRKGAMEWHSEIANVRDHMYAIAASKDQSAFTSAIFRMCDTGVPDASSHTGIFLTGLAQKAQSLAIKSKDSSQAVQLQQIAQYDYTFGQRLIAVPGKCQQAQQAMAEASTQEQQAEANHQANLAAMTNIATALLLGAATYAGAVAQARANATEQSQAYFQQSQTQTELQNLDWDLRRQNNLLQQQILQGN
jgi:hypothetical protein